MPQRRRHDHAVCPTCDTRRIVMRHRAATSLRGRLGRSVMGTRQEAGMCPQCSGVGWTCVPGTRLGTRRLERI